MQPPKNYADEQSRYYVVPLAWLASRLEPSRLDTCDLLLFHTHDGDVIFDELQDETWAQRNDPKRRRRALLARGTYSRHKNALMDEGLLQNYTPHRPRKGVAPTIQRQLQAGLKYRWLEWPPPEPIVYQTRDYLGNRWPAWLGNADIGSRLAILGSLIVQHAGGDAMPDPGPINVSWTSLCEAILNVFGGVEDEAYLLQKLEKGLEELCCLGLAEPVLRDRQWQISFERLADNPSWPTSHLARMLRIDGQPSRLQLIQELMTVCCEPVTRVKTVHNALRQTYHQYLLVDQDARELRRFVRSQRRRPRLPRYNEVLEDYVGNLQRSGKRIVSTSFVLPAADLAVVSVDEDGNPLEMPVRSSHWLNATQLCIECDIDSGTSRDEVRAVLESVRLAFWQEHEDGGASIVPLGLPPLTDTRIQDGFIVRGNVLHNDRIDYRYPFEVLIRCFRPDSRIRLICTIRVLRKIPVRRKRSPRSAKAPGLSPAATS